MQRSGQLVVDTTPDALGATGEGELDEPELDGPCDRDDGQRAEGLNRRLELRAVALRGDRGLPLWVGLRLYRKSGRSRRRTLHDQRRESADAGQALRAPLGLTLGFPDPAVASDPGDRVDFDLGTEGQGGYLYRGPGRGGIVGEILGVDRIHPGKER